MPDNLILMINVESLNKKLSEYFIYPSSWKSCRFYICL